MSLNVTKKSLKSEVRKTKKALNRQVRKQRKETRQAFKDIYKI